jgi:hypothetical protein
MCSRAHCLYRLAFAEMGKFISSTIWRLDFATERLLVRSRTTRFLEFRLLLTQLTPSDVRFYFHTKHPS